MSIYDKISQMSIRMGLWQKQICLVFTRNAYKAFLPYVIALGHVRSFVCSFNTKSAPNISRTAWPIITKFYRNIHTDKVYSHTGYDVTNYFWSEVVAKKTVEKNRLRRLLVEFLKSGLSNDHEILHAYLGTIGPINGLKMTSPAASNQLQIQLNTAQKCVKRVRPTK